jgi:hypothetical protein
MVRNHDVTCLTLSSALDIIKSAKKSDGVYCFDGYTSKVLDHVISHAEEYTIIQQALRIMGRGVSF